MDPTDEIVDDEPQEIESTDTPAAGSEPVEKTPEQKDAEMLEAVSAAIDAETPKPKEAAKSEGDEATDETRERDEHGRFKPKADATGKPAVDPKAQRQPKPGEQQTPKQPDAVNDPIPAEVRGKTRERMETLVKTTKDLSTRVEKAEGERDDILGMIHETKATPEQYGEMLEYLKAVNSGDPEQIRGALTKVQAELSALSRMIGEPVAGVDLVAEHADLKAAVESGDLSPELAQELAAARSMRQVQTQASQQTQQFTHQQRQSQQAIAVGRNALNALEAQLQSDPHYATKRAMLIPMLQPIITQLPPDKWAAAFKQAYDKLPAPAAPSATVTTLQQKPAGQPLRAKQPAGQGARAPSSMLDALNSAIDQVSGR